MWPNLGHSSQSKTGRHSAKHAEFACHEFWLPCGSKSQPIMGQRSAHQSGEWKARPTLRQSACMQNFACLEPVNPRPRKWGCMEWF
ncbi:hypothetical protein V6N12_067084 [Hibiscus sabdariffa]|uniref:Uncharacterized protein n=1 Tax=Hibiscus sabdariffa TaxID=183260 RepID=A0ABR2AMJ7_9ROSI